MTCTQALDLARRGQPDLAADHLSSCDACRLQLAIEDRALEVARVELATEIPPGHAGRVARAALAASRERTAPWWEVSFPVAWRAALALNVLGAALVAWALNRPPVAPPGGRTPTPSSSRALAIDELVDASAGDLVADVLGVRAEDAR